MIEGHNAIFEVTVEGRKIYDNANECGRLPKFDDIVQLITNRHSGITPDRVDMESDATAVSGCCTPEPVQIAEVNVDNDGELRPHDAPWISETVATPVGEIPIVKTSLGLADRLGGCKIRWGIGRMNFKIPPGLYAAGSPTDKAPVFVSANFKLSFDRLRSQLTGIDGWILVLDTKGINVWCAAGKGTFGTDELVARITATGLEKIVSHRRLILPQLGAPGVSAHRVKEQSGFRIIYGPVLANDIPAFLESGLKATSEMRRVRFPLRFRAALIPIELVTRFKYLILAVGCFFILSGFGPGIYSFDRVIHYGSVSAVLLLGMFVVGTVLPPLLLPYLPGRSFAFKGALFGLALALGVWWYGRYHPDMYRHWVGFAAWLAVFPAVISFTTMNFTGCSTYTSLSGVVKEMRRAIPLQIAGAVIGLGLWITGLFI